MASVTPWVEPPAVLPPQFIIRLRTVTNCARVMESA